MPVFTRWAVLFSVVALLAVVAEPGRASQSSVLVVTTTEDTNDGACDASHCSLREAIAAASPGDSIDIQAGTYTLIGQLIIIKDLTLIGGGAERTIIQAAETVDESTRDVFRISSGNVGISGVTIRHGSNDLFAGGIRNAANLTLTGSTVSGNIVTSWGGGIYNAGVLILTNSVISDNRAGSGGGIFNHLGSTLTLTNSTVSGNSAGYSNAGGNGGGIYTRIPHLAQTSDAVNRQLSCFSSRYMNLLAVFQI